MHSAVHAVESLKYACISKRCFYLTRDIIVWSYNFLVLKITNDQAIN